MFEASGFITTSRPQRRKEGVPMGLDPWKYMQCFMWLAWKVPLTIRLRLLWKWVLCYMICCTKWLLPSLKCKSAIWVTLDPFKGVFHHSMPCWMTVQFGAVWLMFWTVFFIGFIALYEIRLLLPSLFCSHVGLLAHIDLKMNHIIAQGHTIRQCLWFVGDTECSPGVVLCF